jgi:hypothetical protein
MAEAKSSEGVAVEDIPNGRGAAAILAAGVGCAAIGVLATLRDAVKPVATALNFYKPTGPLSGVVIVSVVIWLLVWIALGAWWRTSSVPLGRINVAAFALLAVGVLLTFPPFMDFLQGK